ncbi:apolipoprotein N-acyltransferase [uncultured Sphingomonas sp.]|uniref:apolipoprotein N-acyltransferase n=1 Tax=uncultured Sphingomonas sp. TaxID=158754 RepID=UPI0035CC275C
MSTATHSPTRRGGPALACVVLGALAALGFAPLGWWPLTLVAVGAWLWLVHDADRLPSALARGWLFGLGHFTVNDNWIGHAFDFQQAMPTQLGYLAPPLLALYLAVYPMLAAGLAWRLASPRAAGDRVTRPGLAFALVAGAAWIVAEWLRATMFTGYAWDPLGVVWVPVQPVAHLAAWVGTYALSGLTVVLAGVLMLLAGRGRWSIVVAVAILIMFGGLQAISYVQIEQTSPFGPAGNPRPTPRVRIVQPDIGQDQRGEFDAEPMLAALTRLSGRPGPGPNAPPRLLLWPEGVVRDFIEDGYPWQYYVGTGVTGEEEFRSPRWMRARLGHLLGPRDLLLAGGATLSFPPPGDPRRDHPTGSTNAIFAIAPSGRIAGRYDKAHLVPYGEYLPMRGLLSAIGLSRLVPGDIDFVPGPGPRTLALPGFGPVGMQLCYEIVFSGQVVDEAHRPRFLFNPSNDAWFGRWGPPQHLAQARMRAIEEGLPILRATPTGISAVVAADGRLVASIPAGRAGAIEVPLPEPLPPTLFARIGNAMAGLVALSLLALAVAIRRRSRYGLI